MKLNLVADYDIGDKHCCHVFSIDSSNNLILLMKLTTISVPATDGGLAYIEPSHLTMCKSRVEAEEVARQWEAIYKKDGRLYNYEKIDRRKLTTRKEA